ncbi:hypothetical protein ACMTN4_07370 [Rhodococcus globerulus]|uniref:hypothetical protein n=1 Tax=Rhodococcus globerulus TaxID=33008 RepID=UPI0039EAA0DA
MRQPTVGDIVHYQSYGTPGGEYLPEPRAAIITAASGPTDPPLADEPPDSFAVGLCILNPTGMFFNEEIAFAEVPTPGHWNWPPNVDVDSEIQVLVELGENRPCRRCDGCGRVANSEDAEPWTMWEALPPGSDLAVQMGVVRPVTCLDCNGSGTVEL